MSPAADKSCTIPTTPTTPNAHSHIPENPYVPLDSVSFANIPASAASRGVKSGRGIDRQYAVYLDDEDSGTINLETMLKCLAACYPNVGFRNYEAALHSNGITYLDVAVKFSEDWYTNPERIGMQAGEAVLFLEWATREMVREEEAKRKVREIQNAKGRKRVRVAGPGDGGGDENMPPVICPPFRRVLGWTSYTAIGLSHRSFFDLSCTPIMLSFVVVSM